MEQIKAEQTKAVSPWRRSLAVILGVPVLGPLYALFATWVGGLTTGYSWDLHRWVEHNLYDLFTCGLFVGLIIGVVEFLMPQPRSWLGRSRSPKRQLAWMAASLVLVPVGLSLLLKYH